MGEGGVKKDSGLLPHTCFIGPALEINKVSMWGFFDLIINIHIQGSNTLEISKFPTISQLFRSSSPTTSQPKLHGSHDVSEAKFPTFPFLFFFFKCELFHWLSFLIETFFCVDSQLFCKILTNPQPSPGWE